MGHHPRPAWAIVVGFLTVLLSTAKLAAGVDALATIPAVKDASGPYIPKCWVFNHMNKSGGTSIKTYINKWRRGRGFSLGLYDSQEWAVGMRWRAERHLQQNNTFTWGGYTEGLRPYGAQDCKWFTIFRHPISRLVSAYYYCKTHQPDQLCATQARNADTARTADRDDLVSFARHWGNYGLLQFVLGFVKPEDIIPDEEGWATTPTQRICQKPFVRGTREAAQGCPGWYRLKLFVERRSTCTGRAGEDPACESSTHSRNQGWMHQFLQPVMDILSAKYSAVGIMEQWNASMQLFQATLELPGMDWLVAFETGGKENTLSAHQQEREETLRRAMLDSEIRELLWLDLLLYDHAVNVFNKQIQEYGIVAS